MKRHKPKPAPRPPEFDRGPEGEAFQSRPFAMSAQGAVSVGSVMPGRVIEAKRMMDTTLIDRMHAAAQLSDRQHKAARNLLRMYDSGGLRQRTTATLGYVPPFVEEMEEDGEQGLSALAIVLDDGETWRDRLSRILRGFGGHQADLLMDLIQDRHPGMKWLATVQACLSRLSDEWGYER